MTKRNLSQAFDSSNLLPLNFSVLPSVVQLQLFRSVGFRELRGVCQSSKNTAYRLCGVGRGDDSAEAPIYEVFKDLLRRDFGISSNEDECAGSSAFVRSLVAESVRTNVPLLDKRGRKRSALQLVRAYRALYTRLYDSVRTPFLRGELETIDTRFEWRTYSVGGGVSIVLKDKDNKRSIVLLSIVSVCAALAAEDTIESIMAGRYGRVYTVASTTEAPDRRVEFNLFGDGVYVTNIPPNGAAMPDWGNTDLYVIRADGTVFSLAITPFLEKFYDLPGYWADRAELDSWYWRRLSEDSLLLSVLGGNDDVHQFLFSTTSGSFEELPKLSNSGTDSTDAGALLGKAAMFSTPNADGDGDADLEIRFFKTGLLQRAYETKRVLHSTLVESDLFGGETDGVVAWYLTSNIYPNGKMRFFAIGEMMSETSYEDVRKCVVVVIDCRPSGEPVSALAYALGTELHVVPRASVVDGTVLCFETAGGLFGVMRGTLPRIVLLDTDSGMLTMMPNLQRYGWVSEADACPQTVASLSVLNNDFDNSAGVSSARDTSYQVRLVGRPLRID